MKILITTDWYKPVINGVVTSVVNLAHGLETMGHEVRILTLSGSLRSYQENNVTFIGSVSVGLIYPNARLKMALSHRFVRELVEWKPDAVHSQCEFSTFFLAKKIAQECGVPLVHTYHTVYEDYTHYFSPSVRIGKYMSAAFSRRILSNTQAVIAPTEKVATMLAQYGVDQPIFTVPTGLELDRFLAPESKEARDRLRASLGLGAEDFVLTYVGRLAKEKNVEELLVLLKERAPASAKLLLVGDGPHCEVLEAFVRELGLTGRVVFAGMISPEKVGVYYKAGDVFISASQSETQGLTYIEAMACGLPTLCRKDPCLDAVIEHGRNGFEYDSPEQFAAIAEKLCMLPYYRRYVGLAAQESVRAHFSEQRFARAVCEVYHACLTNDFTAACRSISAA